MALNVNYMVRETGSNLTRNPTLTLATIINVGVSLFLVGASLIIGTGAKHTAQRFQNGVDVLVFLRPDISPAQRTAVRTFIDANPLVKRQFYVNKQEAYKEFKQIYKDQPEFVRSLSVQQIPPSFRVIPKHPTIETVTVLKTLLAERPGVFEVAASTDSVRQLQRLSDLMRSVSGVAAAFLLAAALLLIINTIRMAALARRREIEVMKLVGATNWFIRIPFMLEGLAQGLIGAVFAAGGVFGLNEVLRRRFRIGGLEFLQDFVVDTGHVVGTSILILIVGVLVGAIGSGFAVSRFVDV